MVSSVTLHFTTALWAVKVTQLGAVSAPSRHSGTQYLGLLEPGVSYWHLVGKGEGLQYSGWLSHQRVTAVHTEASLSGFVCFVLLFVCGLFVCCLFLSELCFSQKRIIQ